MIRRPSDRPSATIASANAQPSGPVAAGAMNSRAIFRMSTSEPAQVAERRVAGAEVVDGDPDAQVPQRRQARDGRLRVGEHDGLGHLEHEARGRKPGRAEHVGELVDERLLGQLGGGQVDGERDPLADAGPPRRGLAARLEQHRAAEGEDGAALLGQRDELVGLDEAAGRVVPAGEGLDAERRGPSRGDSTGW